jgi:hypothetical protein
MSSSPRGRKKQKIEMRELVFGAERGSTRIKRMKEHKDRSDDGMLSGKLQR